MKKSNKTKCLEMWEWLANHPLGSKEDYHTYLKTDNRADEYAFCWACTEAGLQQVDNYYIRARCGFCPIKWNEKADMQCMADSSPFYKWCTLENKLVTGKSIIVFFISAILKKRMAKKICELIKTTWND